MNSVPLAPRVIQLLVSRVCHDLVGGVSAINAGVELAGDAGGKVDGETLSLIDQSAKQVARRLSFFRFAFGLGGGSGDMVTQRELARLAHEYLGEGRTQLVWPDGNDQTLALAQGKIALSLILLAVDALPRGGTVNVDVAPLEKGVGFALACTGEAAGLKAETISALDAGADPETLTAHTVTAYFCAVMIAGLGGELEYTQPEPGRANLACIVLS